MGTCVIKQMNLCGTQLHKNNPYIVRSIKHCAVTDILEGDQRSSLAYDRKKSQAQLTVCYIR